MLQQTTTLGELSPLLLISHYHFVKGIPQQFPALIKIFTLSYNFRPLYELPNVA